MKNKITVREMTYAALFTVLLAVCSWITIPGPVPFTLQTFAVFAALGMLGAKLGALSIAAWILLGAVGVPVFSNFNGGIGALFGNTGGYILGFILAAPVFGAISSAFGQKLWARILGMLAGLAVMYIFGTAWFVLLYTRRVGEIGVMTALGWCVFPFIIPDIVKGALALLLSHMLKKRMNI